MYSAEETVHVHSQATEVILREERGRRSLCVFHSSNDRDSLSLKGSPRAVPVSVGRRNAKKRRFWAISIRRQPRIRQFGGHVLFAHCRPAVVGVLAVKIAECRGGITQSPLALRLAWKFWNDRQPRRWNEKGPSLNPASGPHPIPGMVEFRVIAAGADSRLLCFAYPRRKDEGWGYSRGIISARPRCHIQCGVSRPFSHIGSIILGTGHFSLSSVEAMTDDD
jgi:hypothetical protein